jgi:hypothetical protein
MFQRDSVMKDLSGCEGRQSRMPRGDLRGAASHCIFYRTFPNPDVRHHWNEQQPARDEWYQDSIPSVSNEPRGSSLVQKQPSDEARDQEKTWHPENVKVLNQYEGQGVDGKPGQSYRQVVGNKSSTRVHKNP